MMGVFESETVTMAMGMLTALMGGAAEVSNSCHAVTRVAR